jgi:transketolase
MAACRHSQSVVKPQRHRCRRKNGRGNGKGEKVLMEEAVMTKQKILGLKKFAAQIRMETIKCVGARGFGHLGGALSIVEALAVLYGGEMSVNPENPRWPDRDKLVLSKGHACPSLYAALALMGYFSMEALKSLNRPGTMLPACCDSVLTPGIDMTTGSPAQGVSAAIGLALAQKMDGRKSRTFLITGDGELDEGQVWEGARFAPSQKLTNLIWCVDYNKRQGGRAEDAGGYSITGGGKIAGTMAVDGNSTDSMTVDNIAAKFNSFGWFSQSVAGNDVEAITQAVRKAEAETERPSCIVLNTKKGAGIYYIEDIEMNHHIVFDGELLNKSIAYMEGVLACLEREGIS